jgi:hypothetical protein
VASRSRLAGQSLVHTLALLALWAPLGLGQTDVTMDLAWVRCRSSTNTTSATLNDVTAAQFDCSSPSSARSLISSFKLSNTAYNSFIGTTVQIDFITLAAPNLPDWWDVGTLFADPNNCRIGGMTRAAVGTHSACANPYGAVHQLGDNVFFMGVGGPGTYRFLSNHVPMSGAPPVSPGTGGYAGQHTQVTNSNAVDEMEGTILCAGCSTPACLMLIFMDVALDYGAGPQKFHTETVTFRSFVTWMGGTGTNCPGAVPTKSSTWGQVKALYR